MCFKIRFLTFRLHVLGGHSSGVIAVYWRTDLDNLLVRCADGSVYVWQLTNGILDRQITGKLAAELIERSEGPGWKKPTGKITFSKQSVYTKTKGLLETVSLAINDQEPDVKLLMLSVRHLIGYISDNKLEIQTCIKNIKQLPLPYVVTTALSYIFEFGHSKYVKELREKLGIQQPNPSAHMGIHGCGTSISLLVPNASECISPFSFSPVLSSLYSINCVAVLKSFSAIPELNQLCNSCIKYYLLDMPREVGKFEEPSFLYSSQFLKDPLKDIQLAAKAVMDSAIKRLSKEKIRELSEQLSTMLLECHMSENQSKKHRIVIALASLLYKAKDIVESRITSITAMGLVEILEKGGSQHVTAISLLGDGFDIWKYYIPDTHAFANQLFKLALPALTLDKKKEVETIAIDALQAFICMANADPQLYVDFINSTVNQSNTPPFIICAAITSLYPLMHKYPHCLIDHLDFIINLILKVLDPHVISIRDACLNSSTNILRYMVEVYPMVSFHQENQKLAVGSRTGTIIVYDIRTASKWQQFEAYKDKEVNALIFSPLGDKIASYCENVNFI